MWYRRSILNNQISSLFTVCVRSIILSWNSKEVVTVILFVPAAMSGIVLLYAVWGIVQRLNGNSLLVVGLTFVL